jgi:putative transposase
VEKALTNDPQIIGFLDEFSPQNNSNAQKLWSIHKSSNIKNISPLKANTFGFYAINSPSNIDFKEHSRKEDITEFLKLIRTINPYGRIIIILDNFRSHHPKLATETAAKLNIDLVFLPPYSPDLNPIEFIWKSIKRELSPLFIKTIEQMRELIEKHFKKFSQSKTYAKNWIKKFLK